MIHKVLEMIILMQKYIHKIKRRGNPPFSLLIKVHLEKRLILFLI